MEKPIFSVLCLNLKNYDNFFDLDKSTINPLAEYIYITDNKSITSNTWTIKYVDLNENDDLWDFCYDVRFNPFNYVNSDVLLRIDASIRINSDITPMINTFNEGKYDAGVLIHQKRQTLYDEYIAWVNTRNYPIEQAWKCMSFLSNENYDVFNYKGLYAETIVLMKNSKFTKDWNRMSYTFLKLLSDNENTIERLNQAISSFVLNKYFNDKKILPLDSDMLLANNHLAWYGHNCNIQLNSIRECEPYLFNKKCKLYSL